jgi:hypothetical protein
MRSWAIGGELLGRSTPEHLRPQQGSERPPDQPPEQATGQHYEADAFEHLEVGLHA